MIPSRGIVRPRCVGGTMAGAMARRLRRCGTAVADGGGGEPGTLLWFSDHRTATGASNNAVRDGTASENYKWPDTLVNAGGLEVVNAVAEGITWPATNALRVTAQQATSGLHRITKNGLAIPGENTSAYYRCAIRVDQGFDEEDPAYDEQNHPIELGTSLPPSVDEDVTVDAVSYSLTEWRIGLVFTDAANAFNNAKWQSPMLTKGITYQFEWRIQRGTGDNCKADVRLRNAAGALLYDGEDFTNDRDGDNPSPTNLTAFCASNDLVLENPDPSLGDICAGLNGLAGEYWHPAELYGYQGCFAVSHTDWIGAYPHADEAA